MNHGIHRPTVRLLLALPFCLADCRGATAYQVPLTPAALHEAYILGQRNDQATASFLGPYLKQITEGSQAPRIAELEILTPFAQVVDLSRSSTSGAYTEEQAAHEHHHHGATVLFPVLLILPAPYRHPPPP